MTQTEITVLSPQLAREIRELVRHERSRGEELRRPTGNFNPDHQRNRYRAKVTTQITAATGLTVGNGVGQIHRRNSGSDVLEPIRDNFPVYNAGSDTYAVDEYVFIGQDAYGDYWVEQTSSPAETPAMRFVTDEKIANRKVQVTVDWADGTINNPSTGVPIVPGDTIDVYDPSNLWGEIEAGATGTAYYRDAQSRWEIETCSLPVKEIRAKLADCLKKTTTSMRAYFGSDPSDWQRSGYENVDMPPEIYYEAGGSFSVIFQNPWKLDAVQNSYVLLRRVTNVKLSDPGNLTVPKSGSATGAVWEVVKVEKSKARWIRVEKQSSTWNLLAWWEGEDPRICGPVDVTCLFPCGCLRDGDQMVAFYDPNSDSYKGVSTESALMGPPQTTDIVQSLAFDGCDLNFIHQQAKVFFCGSSPSISRTSPALVAVDVVSNLYLAYNGIVIDWTTLYVCDIAPGPQGRIAGGDPCGTYPTGDCYEHECEYTWNPATMVWDLTTPCPMGCDCAVPASAIPAPEEGDPTVKNYPCEDP